MFFITWIKSFFKRGLNVVSVSEPTAKTRAILAWHNPEKVAEAATWAQECRETNTILASHGLSFSKSVHPAHRKTR